MKKILIPLFTALLFVSVSWGQTVSGDFVDGALYVKFKDGTHPFVPQKGTAGGTRKIETRALFPTEKGSDLSSYGLREQASSMHLFGRMRDTYRIEFENTQATEQLIRTLSSLPEVDYVERVPLHHLFSVPGDPLYNKTGKADGSWHLKQIGFEKIYGKYKGNPAVKVAVVDNAVWADHPDLDIKPENRYFAFVDAEGECEPPTNIDPDEECESILNCPSSSWSHGTHCAGLIAAVNDNNEGTASFGSGITLLAARASDMRGDGVTKGFECILWAIDKGADIISLSWGSAYSSNTEKEIVETAVKNGVVILAAAGNDAISTPQYPACYEGVIAVGAVNSDNSRASFSNMGDWVDIAAPGGYVKRQGGESGTNLLSTTFSACQYYRLEGETSMKGLYYDGKAGTSMATPLTASVVALMLSVNPDLSPAQVESILKETAMPATDFEMCANSGVIDAEKALKKVEESLSLSNSLVGSEKPRISPNPAKDRIRVDYAGKILQIDILDMNGKRLKTLRQTNGTEIGLENLPQGILLVRVRTNGGEFMQKIIKQ